MPSYTQLAAMGAAVLLAGASLAAQADPLPTRIRNQPCGEPSGTPNLPQPTLAYDGPPATVTPIQKVGTGDSFPDYDLRTLVVAPSSGWDLEIDGISADIGTTHVYLTLTESGDDEIVLPVLTPHVVVAAMDCVHTLRIDVWIQRKQGDGIGLPYYALAAVVDTRY